MFSLIRSLPYIAIVAALAGGAHWFIIQQKDARIASLEELVAELQQENIAFETTNKLQKETIDDLVQDVEKQRQAVDRLSTQTQRLVQERDEYLEIFRSHDLTKLSRAKPGLIEPRINKGTQEVFDTVEKDTQKIEDPNRFNNFIYDDIP